MNALGRESWGRNCLLPAALSQEFSKILTRFLEVFISHSFVKNSNKEGYIVM